jgi:hypothetical protein
MMSLDTLSNPSASLKTAMLDLKSKDWKKNISACNILSTIAFSYKNLHSTMIKGGVLYELDPLCDSLRSQIAKEAISTVTDIY